MTGNKLGDMLLELRDPNLSAGRQGDIVRLLNELGDREEKYRSWLGAESSAANLLGPIIDSPDFRSSPLRVFQVYLSTDTEIANNSLTEVAFEGYYGDTSVFNFFADDPKKISVARSQFNFCIDGQLKWEGNSTGYRTLNMHLYDDQGVSLGTQEIFNVAAVATEPTNSSFSYTASIKQLANIGYITMEVLQNSGGGLDITNFVLSICLK